MSQTDLSKYDSFRMKFDPIYKSQAAGGDGSIIVDWPNTDGAVTDLVRRAVRSRYKPVARGSAVLHAWLAWPPDTFNGSVIGNEGACCPVNCGCGILPWVLSSRL